VSRPPGHLVLTDEDTARFEASGIDLRGGVFSDGVTSIRARMYADLVFEVTGISLYREWIAPEHVLGLSRAFDARSAEDLARVWDRIDVRRGPGHSAEEMAELKCFFRTCAERGLGLVGWWWQGPECRHSGNGRRRARPACREEVRRRLIQAAEPSVDQISGAVCDFVTAKYHGEEATSSH
jgi:hypothetical protein